MADAAGEAVVRKSVRVQAPIQRAFSVFIEQMETWWPATHHIGKVPFETIFVEPPVGAGGTSGTGRRAVRLGNGAGVDPPHRVVFSRHVGPAHDQPDWKADPDMAKASEVEVRFMAEGPRETLVELVHSKLERHGEGYEQLRAMFDGREPGEILAMYAEAVQKASE